MITLLYAVPITASKQIKLTTTTVEQNEISMLDKKIWTEVNVKSEGFARNCCFYDVKLMEGHKQSNR